jgi:hypothetical protein
MVDKWSVIVYTCNILADKIGGIANCGKTVTLHTYNQIVLMSNRLSLWTYPLIPPGQCDKARNITGADCFKGLAS